MALVLENVTREVGGDAYIRDISLTLESGSLNVLLGATLSGKTSLMRLMAGLDAPSRGRIFVDGRDVTGWPVKRRSVAMVYQQFINYPSLSVYENIASPLRVAGLPAAQIAERVADAARLLKLEPFLDRRPLQLSGGQQQRTAIARALVKRADLVLLDEPLANLDYKLREELREELPRIFAESGAIFVYATTEPMEALLLGGNTATLYEGTLTQFGRTAEVYRFPNSVTTAQVFSDPPLNIVEAVKSGDRVSLSTGTTIPAVGVFRRAADGRYTVGFRAHHLAFEPPPGPSIELLATVSVAEITGSESFLHLRVGEHAFVALVAGVHRLDPGTSVRTYLDPSRVFLFDAAGSLAAVELAAA